MPFLVEMKIKDSGWSPVVSCDSKGVADSIAMNASEGVEASIQARVTEMSRERISYRFAQAVADCKFREYLEAHARAYNLKILIQPEHWPEDMKKRA